MIYFIKWKIHQYWQSKSFQHTLNIFNKSSYKCWTIYMQFQLTQKHFERLTNQQRQWFTPQLATFNDRLSSVHSSWPLYSI